MEELGTLVVIFIIVFASVIGKIQEQRKAQERKKSHKPVRPEDLPEATRRLLYGTPEKPASETRRESPQVRTAQPRTAPPVQRQQPQQIPRPVQPQMQRPAQQTVAPPPPPPRRRAPGRQPEGKPETVSLQARHEQMMAQRRKQLQDAQAQHAATVQRAQQIRQGAIEPAQVAPASRRRKAPAVSALFSNLDDVRRGIVMMEVLGTPKAFE
jgi:hypothetical protein